MRYHYLLRAFTLGLIILLISACENQNPDVQHSKPSLKQYNHKGLKLAYPEDWSLNHDRPGEIANRRVEVSTPNFSAITTILFCKTNAFSALEYADILVNETTNHHYKNEEERRIGGSGSIQREKININGYNGFKLNWTDIEKKPKNENDLADIKIEIIILKLRSKPYPIFVQFEFFEDDIVNQHPNIIPFIKALSFDPQEVEIWEPTYKL